MDQKVQTTRTDCRLARVRRRHKSSFSLRHKDGVCTKVSTNRNAIFRLSSQTKAISSSIHLTLGPHLLGETDQNGMTHRVHRRTCPSYPKYPPCRGLRTTGRTSMMTAATRTLPQKIYATGDQENTRQELYAPTAENHQQQNTAGIAPNARAFGARRTAPEQTAPQVPHATA